VAAVQLQMKSMLPTSGLFSVIQARPKVGYRRYEFQRYSQRQSKEWIISTESHITTRCNGDEITIPALAKEIAQCIHSLIQRGIRRSGIGEELI
jgi:hypothetical protein